MVTVVGFKEVQYISIVRFVIFQSTSFGGIANIKSFACKLKANSLMSNMHNNNFKTLFVVHLDCNSHRNFYFVPLDTAYF